VPPHPTPTVPQYIVALEGGTTSQNVCVYIRSTYPPTKAVRDLQSQLKKRCYESIEHNNNIIIETRKSLHSPSVSAVVTADGVDLGVV
jgi:hypothetical protein